MRTTVDIPNPLYKRLKGKAAREGRSIKEIVLRSVVNELKGSERLNGRQVSLPIVPSKRPGSLKLDNAKIYEIIDLP